MEKEFYNFIIKLEQSKKIDVEFISRFQKKLHQYIKFQCDFMKDDLTEMKKHYNL